MNYANNLKFLEENGIRVLGRAWDDIPESVELETYTDAGEDMIINLEAPHKSRIAVLY